MLSTRANDNYNPQGGVGVKYTPLNNYPTGLTVNPKPSPPSNDGAKIQFESLIEGRFNLLKPIASYDPSIHGFDINYYCELSKKDLVDKEKKSSLLAPLLVISSGRSAWIKQQYDKMTKWIADIQVTPHQGISSKDYFPDTGKNYAPIPIYFPQRLKDDKRSVYMFVHRSEYNTYRDDLANIDITIIGWDCSPPVPAFRRDLHDDIGLVGFGMTRASVVQFAKSMYQKECTSWNRVWMIDDNVIFLNTEASNTAKDFTCLSDYEFAFEQQEFKDDYFDGFKADNNPKSQFKVNTRTTNYDVDKLVQQMVYMNINKLSSDNYNFSPFFIYSNEDYSLIQFLSRSRVPPANKHAQFTNVDIIKGQVVLDNSTSSKPNLSLLAKFSDEFMNKNEQDFEVYDQQTQIDFTLNGCIHVKKDGKGNLEWKMIDESNRVSSAKAVEQTIRMSIANGGSKSSGGANQLLPAADYFVNLFQIPFNSHFFCTLLSQSD